MLPFTKGKPEELNMPNRIRFALTTLAAVSVIMLSACSAAATPSGPTIDPNAIYTQAVETVSAGLTQTAVAAPTNTPTPESTATTEPTATLAPTVEPTLDTAATTAMPTLEQPGAATATKSNAVPVATTAALGQAGDHASYGSQSPADNTHFNGLAQGKVFWSLVNTGTTTWNKNYKLKFIGGTALSGTSSIPLSGDVPPGKKGEFYTILVAPGKAGTFVSYWQMFNASGQPVPGSEVYLKFIVP
jgi:hypothetical protein